MPRDLRTSGGSGSVAFLDFFVAREILFLLDRAIIGSPLVHASADLARSPVSTLAAVLPPWISSG